MSEFRSVALETLLVALFASTLALAANAVSPRGLRLDRDYFPGRESSLVPVVPNNGASPETGKPATATDAIMRRLGQHGLKGITTEEASAWHRDPQYQQGLIVFVDARDDGAYRAGHIPGAWQFNHYRPEEQLPQILPACLGALKVVVYCAGGECEDSEFAAVMLRDAGIPAENLFVYTGGVTEWTAKKLPLEVGERGSGQLRASGQP